jgi:TM2 domain-containing membrane protein YozV
MTDPYDPYRPDPTAVPADPYAAPPPSAPPAPPVSGTEPTAALPTPYPPGYAQPNYPQPAYPQSGYEQPGAPPPPGYGQPAYAGGPYPTYPATHDPATGLPYSDKSRVVAGVLQIVLGGFGAGRFYTGHTGMAIAQIAVTWLTCGIGHIWPLIDGIMILAQGDTDSRGLPLRP